jgi:hypothetical protein
MKTMDVNTILNELEIATWELAEAESREKAAAILRRKSAARLASIHLELKAALEQAQNKKQKDK